MRTRYPEKAIFSVTRKFSYTTRRNCYIWYQQFKKAVGVMGNHPLMMLRAFVGIWFKLIVYLCDSTCLFLGLNFDFNLIQVMGRMVFS